MKFKTIPSTQKPREKALLLGLKKISDVELIALFLRTGAKNVSVMVLAQKLIEKTGGIHNLLHWNLKQIMKIKGIGIAKALQLTASMELVRRIKLIENKHKKARITKPYDVFEIMQYEFEQLKNEHFYTLLLDKHNQIIAKKQLYQGTINQILIDLRDIFEFALSNGAQKIICIHNHPSGYSDPSEEDIKTTKEIAQVGKKLNIHLIDHIIIGKNEFYSLVLKKKFQTKTCERE